MIVLLTIIHVLVCIILIAVVLLQSGQSADIAGAFGGAGSQTAFGPRGATTLLSKITTTSAVIFMLTSVTLSVMNSKHTSNGSSVLRNEKAAPASSKPVTPSPSPLPAQQPPR